MNQAFNQMAFYIKRANQNTETKHKYYRKNYGVTQ